MLCRYLGFALLPFEGKDMVHYFEKPVISDGRVDIKDFEIMCDYGDIGAGTTYQR